MRLCMLDQDPWAAKKLVHMYVLSSMDLRPMPYPLEQLRSINLLTNKVDKETNVYLICQFTDELWSIPLRNPEGASTLLEKESMKMKQRLVVRRLKDKSHIYCLVQKGSRDQVLRISQIDEDHNDHPALESVFESSQAKMIVLEADPKSDLCLFVITDQQQILKLVDSGAGKGQAIQQIDMSHHSLADELEELGNLPWQSWVISDRILVIDEFNFSMNSSFFWQKKLPKDRMLLEDKNLPGTLKSIQHSILKDGSTILCCKPLPGTNWIDLMGQYEETDKMQAFIASDNRFLVQRSEGLISVFDKDGYICHNDDDDELSQLFK